MERPTLRQLEILAAIVEAGSFRAAARALGLSQVAVSDHIRQLEARLGVVLFVRVPGGKPSLSSAGRMALDHGRNVLFATDALMAAARAAARSDEQPPMPGATEAPVASKGEAPPAPALQALSAPASGLPDDKQIPITVGAHSTLVARMQERLAAAEDAFPERPIRIDFSIFTAESVRGAFAAGSVDIALFFAIETPADFASDYLWSEPWSFFAADWHPLCDLESVTLDDIAGAPLILPDRSGPLRALYEKALAMAGMATGTVTLGTDDHARVAAEAADGVAIFPAFGQVAAQFSVRPGFRRLPLAFMPPPVAVRRAIAPRAQDDAVVLALAGLLG